MKTFSLGLSDSIASVIADAPACPRCDSSSHVAGGLCVGCLLQSGLDPDDDCEPEALVSALAEINLPDQNWRLGNYEILEEIGRGGMGVIYRARQRHSRRIVAVKRVLSYHSDSRETLARFRREAQAAASLDHPNILPIYEVSESDDGLPFFSMKFAPGGNLQEVGPALRNDPRQCVALVAKVARAVQYAHAKGILHRDLKPGNILLDARGEPLVSDFGLAKWLDITSDLTRTLTIFGTPGYIAPEQASGPAAQLKPAADVYSLGAILFDLLAGRPPFLGAHALSVIRQAAESPAPKLRTLSKLADRDLETICAHCLEREPKLRYPSAHDLAEDLERWLEGRPIIARPVLPPVRVWRTAKRNPLYTATLVACVLVGAVAVSRQMRNYQLGKTVEQQATAKHSIEVASFFDLDRVDADPALGSQIALALTKQFVRLGPGNVSLRPSQTLGAKWSLPSTATAVNSQARTVLVGTTRKTGDKTRVSIQVLEARTGKAFLHRTFTLENQASAGDQIAESLARELYDHLSASDLTNNDRDPDPGLRNSRARELIVSGRELANSRAAANLERAIACFRKAIEVEPDSSVAHSCLAMALTARTAYGSNEDVLVEAEWEANEALRLNNDNGEAHRMLAGVLYFQGNLTGALDEIHQAFECPGTNTRGASLAGLIVKTLGRPDRALTWLEIAKTDEAHPAEHDAAIGDCWADLVDDQRAEQAYRRYWELRPQHPEGWIDVCRLRMLQGEFAEAKILCTQNGERYKEFAFSRQMEAQVAFFTGDFAGAEKLYAQLAKASEAGGDTFYGGVTYQSALGWLRIAAGDERGQAILRKAKEKELRNLTATPTNPDVLYRLAAIEASLGEREAALNHLRSAMEEGWIDYRSLQIDPRFAQIRELPSYRTLCDEMKHRVATLRRAVQNISEVKPQ